MTDDKETCERTLTAPMPDGMGTATVPVEHDWMEI